MFLICWVFFFLEEATWQTAVTDTDLLESNPSGCFLWLFCFVVMLWITRQFELDRKKKLLSFEVPPNELSGEHLIPRQ